MAMRINEAVRPAAIEVKYLTGTSGGITVDNGKTFTIETTPGGEEYLSRAPDAGKKWINGKITVYFEEVDI